MGKIRVVDVLVIAASLIFLVAMVPPTFYQSRELVHRARCASNLKQIMIGVSAYTLDYDGHYPSSAFPGRTISVYSHYKDLGILYPGYVDFLHLFACASSGDRMPERVAPSHWYDNRPFRPNEAKQASYAYSYDGSTGPNRPWTEAALATTRVVADRHASKDLTSVSNHGLEGRNAALADGSVKWVSGKGRLLTDPENPDPKIKTQSWWSERGG